MVSINNLNFHSRINFRSNIDKTNPQNSSRLKRSSLTDVTHQGCTLVSSPGNSKLRSEVLKWLGAAAAAGMGALTGVLSKGKEETLSVQRRAENIEFKKAQSMEEAVKFAKEQLGVDLELDDNLPMANFINEQLVMVNNFMKGKSVMPKRVKINNIRSAEGNKGFAGWCDKTKTLSISKGMEDMFNTLSEKSNGNILKYMKQLVNDTSVDLSLRKGVLILLMVIPHELGHANHLSGCIKARLGMMDTLGSMKCNRIKNTSITEEFLEKIKNTPILQKTLRDQAKTAPMEFVADYFAWRVLGIELPQEAEKIIEELYTKYQGPRP